MINEFIYDNTLDAVNCYWATLSIYDFASLESVSWPGVL